MNSVRGGRSTNDYYSPPTSYHGDRNQRASSHYYNHSYYSTPDMPTICNTVADRALYKHFPCTACGKYNRCFFLRCKNLHPYINFDRTVDFMQSDIGKQYDRRTGCKSLKADAGPNSGTDQYSREERRQFKNRPNARTEGFAPIRE